VSNTTDSGRNILVAGGAGFIGSHLCDTLIARGDRVTVVDNLCTGRLGNIEHLLGHERFEFCELDVVDAAAMGSAPALSGPFDVVCNLASPATPTAFATMPLEILAVGSTGTKNLLEMAERDGARFVITSTSEVYGDPLVHPQPESYLGNVSSIGPRSCYDEAKRFSEAITMAMHRNRGANVGIIRIFNTYGPRMAPDDGRVVTNFIRQALADEPITLYGSGSQTRSFCFISDQVLGITAMIDNDFVGPVNIGNPHEVTMSELAETIVRLTDSASELVLLDLPPERTGDPERRCPDISLAQSELGWSPTVGLDDGLMAVIGHFREHEDLGSGSV
jgi:dTDP-glucose 4,6-dehydratase